MKNLTRPRPATGVSDGIERFLAENPELPTPFLVVDLGVVAERYAALTAALPDVGVFYAVKANPAPEVLARLAADGSSFDVASVGEIDRCLDLGIDPRRMSYGNTVKKESDIRAAVRRGVRIFAVDSPAELDKICRQVPQDARRDSTVLVRLASECAGADWPLSRKFGCTPAEALVLLRTAAEQGLRLGVSFHVGSQQHDPTSWNGPLADVAALADALQDEGHRLEVVNLGGGLPSNHLAPTAEVEEYGDAIRTALHRHLGARPGLRLMVEPGRYLVGDAGLLRSEVVLISEKAGDAGRRWVYLDIGMFGGLAETQDEAIRYRIRCPQTSGPLAPAVLAGPTCDSVDVLYEREPYPLPTDLAIGGMVDVLGTGAYTATYCSVWFNGFEPLRTYHVG